MKRLWNGQVLYSPDGGGGAGLDESQFSMMEDMLDDSGDSANENEDGTQVSETLDIPEGTPEEPAEVAESLEDKELETEDEVFTSEQTIQNLRDQLLALTESLQNDPLQQKVLSEVVPPTADGVQTQAQTSPQDMLQAFLSPEELDRLIDEPQLLNVAFARSQQSMLSNVGSLVTQEVQRQIMVSQAVSNFYTANPDLAPYANFVKFVMSEVEGANRDKTYAEIFATTAKECRKRLGISSAVTRDTNKGSVKPAFVGGKRGNARPAPRQEFFDRNAEEMLGIRD